MKKATRPRRVVFFAAACLLVALTSAWILVGHLGQDDDSAAVPSVELDQRDAGPSGHTEFLARVLSLAEPMLPDEAPGMADESAEESVVAPMTAVESLESVPHHTRDSNPYRQYVDVSVFEDWYADASDEDLVLAKHRIMRRLSPLVQDSVAQRFADGLADEREFVETRMRDQEPDEDNLPEPKPSFGLYGCVRSEDLGSGYTMRERLTLPWDEYASIYDLQDELNWVNHQKRLREKAAGTK